MWNILAMVMPARTDPDSIRALLDDAARCVSSAPGQAANLADQALRAAQALGDLALCAEAGLILARAHLEDGRCAEASRHAFRAVGWAEIQDKTTVGAAAALVAGQALLAGGDTPGAVAYGLRARDLAGSQADWVQVVEGQLVMARGQARAGAKAAAADCANDARETAERHELPLLHAQALILLGSIRRTESERRNREQAVSDLRRAMRMLAGQRGTWTVEAELQLSLALEALGEADQALAHARNALMQARRAEDGALLARCALRLGALEMGAGRTVEAKLLLNEAAEFGAGPEVRADIALLLAGADEKVGAFPSACEHLKRAVQAKEEAAALAESRLVGCVAARAEFELGKLAAETDRIRSVELVEAGKALHRTLEENRQLQQQLQVMSTTDPLTRVCNRRQFMVLAEREFSRSSRYNQALTLAIVDIDGLGAINENQGHAVGDEVLRTLAKRCAEGLRDIDVIGRIGGDEFAIALVATAGDDALKTAERIRQFLAGVEVNLNGSRVRSTVSIGLADRGERDQLLNTLFRRAEAALAKARQAGGNRVVAF